MNVIEMYSVKKISDAQISHLSQNEPNEIRTFLGFETKFRCFYVFDYLKKHKNSLNFKKIKVLLNPNEIEFQSLIKSNLFYLEIQNVSNYSMLFSIEYQDSFIFTNDSTYSTFLSFNNEEEMKKATQMIKSSSNNNSSFIIKNMKFIDHKEFSSIFFNEENSNSNLLYIIFRLKYSDTNQLSILKKDFLQKMKKFSSLVKSDLVCKLDNKRYFIVGFDSIEKRNDAFSYLNKELKSSVLIKSFYPDDFPNHKKLIDGKKETTNIIIKSPIFKPKNGMVFL